MNFRNPKTEQVFQSIEEARRNFCTGKDCDDCPLGSRNNGTGNLCTTFMEEHLREAMRIMDLVPVPQDGDDQAQIPVATDQIKKADPGSGIQSSAATPTRRSILRDAEKCVVGARDQDYGSPENSFAVIGKLWGIYLEEKCLRDGRITILPEDTAALMCLFKTARVATGHGKTDNWVDLAGYAACGGEIEGGKK